LNNFLFGEVTRSTLEKVTLRAGGMPLSAAVNKPTLNFHLDGLIRGRVFVQVVHLSHKPPTYYEIVTSPNIFGRSLYYGQMSKKEVGGMFRMPARLLPIDAKKRKEKMYTGGLAWIFLMDA
jgi:hypothetical protein